MGEGLVLLLAVLWAIIGSVLYALRQEKGAAFWKWLPIVVLIILTAIGLVGLLIYLAVGYWVQMRSGGF